MGIDCANDPLVSTQTESHADDRCMGRVDHAALDGHADTLPANNDCPRAPSGADVLTDVVVK